MATKTILVVDDDAKTAELVKLYLERDGHKVLTAYDGNQALEVFRENHPNLVVLDVMLPGIDGVQICRILRDESDVPIIMLTARTRDEDKLTGLDTGADDYVTKPFSPRQLMARVEAVLRRTTEEPVPLAGEFSYNDGELVIDGMRHEVRKHGVPVSLTPNEYKILMTMAKYPTRAFSRDELIAFALGDEFDGFDRVIDTHIKNIRQKLGDDSKSPSYIITVHGTGYKFGGE